MAPIVARAHTLFVPGAAASTQWHRIVFMVHGWGGIQGAAHLGPLTCGTVLTIPPGLRPRLQPLGVLRTVTLYAAPTYLAEQLRWHSRQHPLVHQLQRNLQDPATVGKLQLPPGTIARLQPALLRLIRLSQCEGRRFAMLSSASEVFDIVGMISGLATCVSSVVRRLPRRETALATRLLQCHPEYRWNVEVLAQHVLISTSQLARDFRADLGISPAAYLRQVRTDRMAELLGTSTSSVADAASRAGWANASVAARAFKKRYGVSPSDFASTYMRPTPAVPR